MEIRDMDSFWLGYCVGVFEGEGTANTWTIKSNPNRIYGRLVVRMTDKEPVQRLHDLLGGVFVGPYSSPFEKARGYKPKFRWTVSRVDDYIRLASFMAPFLCKRRQDQLVAALAMVEPSMRRPVVAGNRRNGQALPLRPRKVGQLDCPKTPEPSAKGYQRHRRLGIPVCDVCRESFRLYYADKRKWSKDKIREVNREQYLKNREARILQAREYRKRKRQEGESSETTN